MEKKNKNVADILKLHETKLIEDDDKMRADKCLQNVQAVLKQYDCNIVPVISIHGSGGIRGGIEVVALPRDSKGNGKIIH